MQHGYPDERDLFLLNQELNTDDFDRGAIALIVMLESTGYGSVSWINNGRAIQVTTGGWSGCEEILEATHGTIWRSLYWQASYRGGREVFCREE